jgi:hypothetical protein
VDLSAGFQVESPDVFVPWGISERALLRLLPITPEHVTSGYYVIDCTSLGGLAHALGFHFKRGIRPRLVELEFFRRSYPDLGASFAEFQHHLEATFGLPTSREPGLGSGFPRFSWRQDHALVRHFVMDRFGPEETVSVVRT